MACSLEVLRVLLSNVEKAIDLCRGQKVVDHKDVRVEMADCEDMAVNRFKGMWCKKDGVKLS
eukprot:3914305-Rhodomonas_salina.1